MSIHRLPPSQAFAELTDGSPLSRPFLASASPRTGVGMIKGATTMQRLVISAVSLAALSGIALAAPAHAAGLSYGERVAISHSKQHLNALRHRVRADGHVSLWERMK